MYVGECVNQQLAIRARALNPKADFERMKNGLESVELITADTDTECPFGYSNFY